MLIVQYHIFTVRP